MTSAVPASVDSTRPRTRLRWWREVLYVAAFYAVYSLVRNRGVATDSVEAARENALDIIRIEQWLGTYHEETIQDWFLPHRWFIWFWNVFYGTAHFLVTAGGLVWLFRRFPERYARWRTTLACTTALALIGYAFYPLMPPRLMPPEFGFEDTLATVGGLWSFDSGTMKEISNQYAAMPSMHFGWAAWCAFVFYPGVRRQWLRGLVVLYPLLTLFAIVVTANHFWLDALGGAIALAAGYGLAHGLLAIADRWPGSGRRPDRGADPHRMADALEVPRAGATEAHPR